jgi:hypothetical protein
LASNPQRMVRVNLENIAGIIEPGGTGLSGSGTRAGAGEERTAVRMLREAELPAVFASGCCM